MNLFKSIGVGTLSLALVFAAFAVSLCLSAGIPAFIPWSRVFLGGFIGGFTNRVAIRMLFTRYRLLPGSGVLLKRRDEIIGSLADMVETHLMNPGMVEDKFREAIRRVRLDDIRNGAAAVVDEFKAVLLEYVNSRAAHEKVAAMLREKLGAGGRLLDVTGIKDIDVMAHEILDVIDEQIGGFEVTEGICEAVMERAGGLEGFFFDRDNPLLVKNLGSRESLASLVFSRLDVRAMVVDKLSRYPSEKVRDIIEDSVKEHLVWLELFGVVLGAAFSAVFVFVR